MTMRANDDPTCEDRQRDFPRLDFAADQPITGSLHPSIIYPSNNATNVFGQQISLIRVCIHWPRGGLLVCVLDCLVAWLVAFLK